MSYFIDRSDINGVGQHNKHNAAMQFQQGLINSGRDDVVGKWHKRVSSWMHDPAYAVLQHDQE